MSVLIPRHRHKLDREAEEQRQALYAATMNDAAIGRTVDRDRATIRCWRVTRSLPSHIVRRAATEREIATFLSLYADGISDSEIGRRLGRSRMTVRDWRIARGLPSNRRAKRYWTGHGDPRYLGPSPADIALFLEMHRAGKLDREIAAALDRDKSTICAWRIARRLSSNRPVGSGCVDPRYARSLDAPMLERGMQMHDILRDDSWSNWLEEMGATVW